MPNRKRRVLHKSSERIELDVALEIGRKRWGKDWNDIWRGSYIAAVKGGMQVTDSVALEAAHWLIDQFSLGRTKEEILVQLSGREGKSHLPSQLLLAN